MEFKIEFILLLVSTACIALSTAEDPLRNMEFNDCPKSLFPKCKTLLEVGIKNDEKDRLVSAHNLLRGNVNIGRPERLVPLEWDDKYAKMAQLWANEGVLQRDQCRLKVSDEFGQIVSTGIRNAKKASVEINGRFAYFKYNYFIMPQEAFVQAWHQAIPFWDKNHPSDKTSFMIGNAEINIMGDTVAILSNSTRKMGCGAITCVADTDQGLKSITYQVCNYKSINNRWRNYTDNPSAEEAYFESIVI